ncbi:MAG: undecaprenyl-diphosphate phosphatase [Candidatus Komeilibacteria bacterium]|nr:undecaprenyl-diphosphate phosphatase [Candidatus Komeilibacteria bacterium]
MSILYIIFSSFIQSLTEFLPISSSGHLLLWHELILSPVNDFQLDIVLHLGSVLAVIVYFSRDIATITTALWRRVRWGEVSASSRLGLWVVVSTLPAAVIGFILADVIENFFRAPQWVALMLVLVGLLFIYIEKKIQAVEPLENMTWRQALLIGFGQCLAFIPGTSRSGITLSTAMMVGINRAEAARYSFWLAVPTLLGASAKGIIDMMAQGLNKNAAGLYIIGGLVAFFCSWLVIKYFIQYLQRHSLVPFAVYRIALAVIVIIILL